jgi:oxygen-independent coproporphyrinogen III oxidase
MKMKHLWKPIIQRAVTGHWKPFRMKPVIPPTPAGLKHAGLYLHVPFCEDLCPYCPYNRVKYDQGLFARYESAVHQEIDLYAPCLAGTTLGCLYVGGGTPTVNAPGLQRILAHLKTALSFSGDICVELHPRHMDDRCLAMLRSEGVTLLSLGIESISDHLLARIGRKHDGRSALDALSRARKAGFKTVNVDLMFSLPGQTIRDWEDDLRAVLDLGVDQLSTYPMFAFPYTDLGKERRARTVVRPPGRSIRRMLEVTDRLCSADGLERCAVWSWLRPGGEKFSSITRHRYIGFGPSAASMTGTHFYVNSFDVDAYASSLPAKRPIALSMGIDKSLEMSYWLYWRVYELSVGDADFRKQFGEEASLTSTFGHVLWPLCLAGMAERTAEGFRITPSGAYWVHRLQNEYSLNYIDRLWGVCRRNAWPGEVVL